MSHPVTIWGEFLVDEKAQFGIGYLTFALVLNLLNCKASASSFSDAFSYVLNIYAQILDV